MNISFINRVYLIGIGGIGMSALARYFNAIGKNVAGYDKTSSNLTNKLIDEGIDIHFSDNIESIPYKYKDTNKIDSILIVYTPAIPINNIEYNYFKDNKFNIYKRSEVLGEISKNNICIAVAGTHGKTTVSTLTAHLLKQSDVDCSAFLGGISNNYKSNLILSENIQNKKKKTNNDYLVVEADEFDRSFLKLYPDIALITAIDADHLDIYKNKENLIDSFKNFINKINSKGKLVVKKGLEGYVDNNPKYQYTYSLDEPEADFYAKKIEIKNGLYHLDIVCMDITIKNVIVGIAGKINAENAIAATALAYLVGVEPQSIRKSTKSFNGIKRRFDFQINNDSLVYIDDYAHHPEEIKAFLKSVKELFKDKKITGIFQPHLFTRTRDFADEFAKSLDLLDEVILLDIYPAREKPIENISSKTIFDKIENKHKTLCKKENLIELLKNKNIEVLVTLGAGDIDRLVLPIKNELRSSTNL